MDVDNYSSGNDIVVEFLRLRFSFNASDFAQRVCAAAFRLGLVDDNELDDDETEDLVELTADGMIDEPRSASMASRSDSADMGSALLKIASCIAQKRSWAAAASDASAARCASG